MSQKTVRIELPDSQWVELHSMGRYSIRKIKDLAAEWDAAREAKDAGGGVIGNAEQERLFRERIAAWHLIDPDSATVLTDPATDDLGSLELETVGALLRAIEEMFAGATPKAATAPAASSRND